MLQPTDMFFCIYVCIVFCIGFRCVIKAIEHLTDTCVWSDLIGSLLRERCLNYTQPNCR